MSDPLSGYRDLAKGVSMRAASMDEVRSNTRDGELLKVGCPLRKRDNDPTWPPVDNEWLWVKPLDPERYSVDNIPFFADDFSFGDIVRIGPLKQLDGDLGIAGVIEHAGHTTYRVRLVSSSPSDVDKYSIAIHLKGLTQLGCGFELGAFDLIAIDVPPGAERQFVVGMLESGSEDGVWDWECGFFSPAEITSE